MRNVNLVCVVLTVILTLVVWFVLGLLKGPVSPELITGAQSILTAFILTYFETLRTVLSRWMGQPDAPATAEPAAVQPPAPIAITPVTLGRFRFPSLQDPLVFAFVAALLIILLHEGGSTPAAFLSFTFADMVAREFGVPFELYDALPGYFIGYFSMVAMFPLIFAAGAYTAVRARRRFATAAERQRAAKAFLTILFLFFMAIGISGAMSSDRGALFLVSYATRFAVVAVGFGAVFLIANRLGRSPPVPAVPTAPAANPTVPT